MRGLELVIMVHQTDGIQTELARIRTVNAVLTGHLFLFILPLTLISMILKPRKRAKEKADCFRLERVDR